MSNRAWLIASLLLLASKLSGQTTTLELRVYDYAGLPLPTLHKFAARTADVLSEVDVLIQVKFCGRNMGSICDTQPISAQHLVLRVLPGSAKKMNHSFRSPLGQSMAGPTGGTYASVFLETVQDEAAEANVDWVMVLSYAAAHEIGHLLLGSGAHTPRGLMKAQWDRNDYLDMAQKRFHFSGEQARQLASRYGSAHPDPAATDAAIQSRR
jgi:hypothetical protein